MIDTPKGGTGYLHRYTAIKEPTLMLPYSPDAEMRQRSTARAQPRRRPARQPLRLRPAVGVLRQRAPISCGTSTRCRCSGSQARLVFVVVVE
jgi:hypothetical protein